MSIAELLIEEIKTLPEDYTAEVLDFVGYLKAKAAKKKSDIKSADNESTGCPICDKLRDPVTGELPFNAKTIAAFEEGDAMLRGKIPAKWYNSLDEMMADLVSDDD